MTLSTPKRLLCFNPMTLGLLVGLIALSWPAFSQETEATTPSTNSKKAEPDIRFFDQVAPQFWQEVTPFIQKWGKAWADQDIETYLASYSPKFVTQQGKSFQQWSKSRRQRFARLSNIDMDIAEVRMAILSDQRVDLIFNQRYQDNNYQDYVQKSLQLERTTAGKWLIIAEKQIKKL